MRKRTVGALLAALATLAAITVGASVAQGASGPAAAAKQAEPICLSPADYLPVAALKAASGRKRDLVTNQYDLPTPERGYSPFFTPNVTVKVYFHVIRQAASGLAADGDIPAQWITDQITQLNNAYSGGEGGADTGLRFVLGGTDRTTNATWFNGLVPGGQEKQMKKALRTGGYFDLNVYTADLGGGLLGWATFPKKNGFGSTFIDGVVVYHQSLPGGNADFGTDADYNDGDTLSHEAGHWLGLYHTFQDGCKKNGDLVDDTPAHIIEFDCVAADSCPTAGSDPIHNYMNYTDDPCMTQFTAGQTARAQGIWDMLRAIPPKVKSFKPSKGPATTPVVIKGGNMSDATNVMFGAMAATFVVDNDGQITANVPAGLTVGTKVQVTVVGKWGTTISNKKFTVQ